MTTNAEEIQIEVINGEDHRPFDEGTPTLIYQEIPIGDTRLDGWLLLPAGVFFPGKPESADAALEQARNILREQEEDAEDPDAGVIDAEMPTWRELRPEGRFIYNEGDDPVKFAQEIKEEFGFDPLAGGFGFHCPPVHAICLAIAAVDVLG